MENIECKAFLMENIEYEAFLMENVECKAFMMENIECKAFLMENIECNAFQMNMKHFSWIDIEYDINPLYLSSIALTDTIIIFDKLP